MPCRDDTAIFVAFDAVFNGGPGNDDVGNFGLSGTFNGGSGDDTVSDFLAGSTFAGGGGSDCYYSGDPATANIYSAEPC